MQIFNTVSACGEVLHLNREYQFSAGTNAVHSHIISRPEINANTYFSIPGISEG